MSVVHEFVKEWNVSSLLLGNHFQSESDDTELRTRFPWFVWLVVVFPRKITLFLSVSWIFTSYRISGRCIRLIRFCQMNTATFSVVLGWLHMQWMKKREKMKIAATAERHTLINIYLYFKEIHIFVQIFMV